MQELSLLEIVKYSIDSLVGSQVFILLILEMAILLISLIFSKLMNKKVVKVTSILASLIVLGFYITNYVNTVVTFINNVSTQLMELLYFPTTLEFMVIMIVSFVIMFATLANKKNKTLIKVVNSALPITISFLFLCIIEYINVNGVPFDEFSVFTNPILMSLYELAMGLFMSWLIGLIVYKIDLFIISSINSTSEEANVETLVTVNIDALEEEKELEEELELPKLKHI